MYYTLVTTTKLKNKLLKVKLMELFVRLERLY